MDDKNIRKKSIANKNIVLILSAAIMLGVLGSVAQIYIDLLGEKRNIRETLDEILTIATPSAKNATYTLDSQIAEETITRLKQFQGISHIEIYPIIGDNRQKALAQYQAPEFPYDRLDSTNGQLSDLINNQFFKEEQKVQVTLNHPNYPFGPVGGIIIGYETEDVIQQFIRRSMTTLVIGLTRNIVLALFLLGIFHITITKPLLSLKDGLRKIDPHNPDQNLMDQFPDHQQDEIGEIVRSFSNFLNRLSITDKERETAQEILKGLVNNAPTLIAVKDYNLRYKLINRRMAEALNITAEEAIGKRQSEFDQKDVAKRAEDDEALILINGNIIRGEHKRVTLDGSIRYYLTAHFLISSNAASEDRLIGVVEVDITERKKSEEIILTVQKQARNTARMLQTAMDAVGTAIVAIDEQANLVAFNDHAATALGHYSKGIGRSNIDKLKQRLTRQQINLPQTAESVAEKRSKAEESQDQCFILEQTTADQRTIKYTYYAVQGGGLVVTIEDISEQRDQQKRIYEEEKLRALGKLTGGIAHDFNNMLQVVLGNLNILKDKLPETTDNLLYHRLITGALQSGQNAANLTSRMLSFARKQPLRPEVLCMNDLIQKIHMMLEHIIGDDITLTISITPKQVFCNVDRTYLENTLVNLAKNAKDALEGQGEMRIRLDRQTLSEKDATTLSLDPGQYCVIDFSDNGKGIEAENLGKIFDPFFTTKNIGEGTGLGLSMIHGFVRQSGGTIYVTSTVGEGTTVSLYFPATEQVTIPTLEEKTLEGPYLGNGETILVIEDDPAVRAYVLDTLSSLNYKTHEASTQEEVKAFLAKETKFDLILSDIMLGENTHGADIQELISIYDPLLPILFMSGYAAEAKSHKSLHLTENNFIEKPFSKEGLSHKIHRLLSEETNINLEG